ncbi:MAG: valine--pyruvate transaminase [Desulfobulbaceae bacterium]|nr:valine--pyruvate transaminase [Desulfobulbaceae bacterium]
MSLSSFGEKFSSEAGILTLMDDLGNALSKGGMMMLGGGNPGHIPLVQEVFRRRLQEIIDNPPLFQQLIGIYDPPQGELLFLDALAELFQREYGWPVGLENICLTNGSQNSFFMLFNMFAGSTGDGVNKKILLPLAPEYIGYADLGLTEDFFVSVRPLIETMDGNFFKYRIDFDHIEITRDIGALCVSRPTNPTGNVLTDKEVEGLMRLASENGIPLIIDNAYGVPFPGIIYTEATPFWNKDVIVCMSLSKFGLPAARTGIVVARPETIRILSRMNAVMNLATGSFGAMLATDITRSGEILRLSREVIHPFYKSKMEMALELVHEYFQGMDYLVHVPEGAMFLWLWFKDLPITSHALYERLKKRNVLVVSGHYFFPGLDDMEWSHIRECIRITYSQDDDLVRNGLKIIAQEVRTVYGEQ